MYKIKKQKNKRNKRKKILLMGAVVLLILAASYGIYQLQDSSTPSSYTETDSDQTTSTVPSAQEDFSDGDQREPASSSNSEGSGGITDTNGSLDGVDTSNPTVSSTGEISVYSPRSNEVIKSGSVVSGTSTLATVSYRLIDSISGVIATGNLVVVNGKFSGTVNFATNAETGRLDIYGEKPDGVEFSAIEIPLRFK